MPEYSVFSMWEAVMEIVVAAYKLSTLNLTEMTDNNPTTYFIINNNLNSVLIALNQSNTAIFD